MHCGTVKYFANIINASSCHNIMFFEHPHNLHHDRTCVTLVTPFDIVVHDMFDYGYHPMRAPRRMHVLRICSHLVPQTIPKHDLECIRHVILQRTRCDTPKVCILPTSIFKTAQHCIRQSDHPSTRAKWSRGRESFGKTQ